MKADKEEDRLRKNKVRKKEREIVRETGTDR